MLCDTAGWSRPEVVECTPRPAAAAAAAAAGFGNG